MREYGFVASSAMDWTLAQASFPLSIVLFMLGASAASLGSMQLKYGTRATLLASSVLFGGGMLLGSLGIATHQLWLLYLGYGFLAGMATGVSYTPPIQALIEWFPERKGFASGIAVAGFGSGAIIFTKVFQYLSKTFQVSPEYAGAYGAVQTVTQNGRLFVDQAGGLREVVLATAGDLSKFPNTLAEGFYYVGTGNTGAAAALALYGGVSSLIMICCAFLIKKPAPGYLPKGYTPPTTTGTTVSTLNVHVDKVMKTPQYWLLASSVYMLGTGAVGFFSVAKPMMSEIFGNALPKIVNASFAATFVLCLSAGNLFGRIVWALVSDKIGRRATFFIFTLGGIPIYFFLPTLISSAVAHSSLVSLYGFIGCSMIAISFMGGAYSVLPAYEADLYGPKYVGPIHGRFLLSSSAASLTGPPLLFYLRKKSEMSAINDLISKMTPEKFKEVFGVDLSKANELIEAKTITINKLMKEMPEGVQNPSPYLYDSTLYTMAGLMTIAAVSHYMVKPVNKKYFSND